MSRPDDLAPLLFRDPGPGLGFRQGTVVSYNSLTGENTIQVGGGLVADLPILNTSEALLLEAGSVVGILTAGSSWFILGRITVPGTPDALTALQAVRTVDAAVLTSESTTSLTYTDLATPGPEVTATIGPSGRCLVTLSAEIVVTAEAGAAIDTSAGYMSVELTGANAQSPQIGRRLYTEIRYDESGSSTMEIRAEIGASRTFVISGLTPGETTFTCKYATSTELPVTFRTRSLLVMTL